jgi:hypothetical protein
VSNPERIAASPLDGLHQIDEYNVVPFMAAWSDGGC